MPSTKSRLPANTPALPEINPQAAMEPEFSGQRRLIRPTMKDRGLNGRTPGGYAHNAALTARAMQPNAAHEDSSYAEVFYFQKQIQAQTRMVVVLENGEQLEGVIEWYDRYAIKLRNLGHTNGISAQANGQENGHAPGRNRVLIYKDCIRYIYKVGEAATPTML